MNFALKIEDNTHKYGLKVNILDRWNDSLDTLDCRSWYHSPRLYLEKDPWDLIYPLPAMLVWQGERAKVQNLLSMIRMGHMTEPWATPIAGA